MLVRRIDAHVQGIAWLTQGVLGTCATREAEIGPIQIQARKCSGFLQWGRDPAELGLEALGTVTQHISVVFNHDSWHFVSVA